MRTYLLLLLGICLITELVAQPNSQPTSVLLPKITKFDGGELGFAQAIDKLIEYPLAARNAGVEGKVILELRISAQGTIADVLVRQSLGYGCDEEAIRCLETFKQEEIFSPGEMDGQACEMPYFFSLVFSLHSRLELQRSSPQPQYDYALFNRAMEYFARKRYRKALKFYDQYLARYPEDEDGYLYRGKCKQHLRKMDGCSDFQKAQELGSAEARLLLQDCNN